MSARGNEAATASDREIVLTRVFDAPRALVWRAFTDPAHVTQWWGPTGFTTTTVEMQVRPGGRWKYVMRGPDGREYPNLITYLEVTAPARLVYRHGGEVDVEPVNFEVTATFDEEPGDAPRTRVTLRMVFPSAQARDRVVREYGAIEGGKQTLARLAQHVAGLAAGVAPDAGEAFVLHRVLAAPRELVYRVWTERDHLMRWFGPKGCTIPTAELDLRPGGRFHYCMRFPNGQEMWGRWEFRAIVPRERLEFVAAFSDASGGVVRAPFFEDWPLETSTTVVFEDHAGLGRGTVVTLRAVPLGATAAERARFRATHDSMRQGWGGTFDQLVQHLAAQ